MPNTFDAEEFVHTCREAARDSTPTVAVQEVVRRACSEPSALAAALGHKMGPDGGILHYCDELTVSTLFSRRSRRSCQ